MPRTPAHLVDDLEFQALINRFVCADPFVAALPGFASMLARVELV